ncbi:MAG: allantoicase [Gammaproteobacteria bacterium]|nr:allantoicase [Gammaproteobacteria bacterium]
MHEKEHRPFGVGCIDLAQPRLGACVITASDEFFGAKERMLNPADPVFIADRFDAHGKWMDGWETRRRRTPGHDHAVIKLGRPGVIRGINICTRYFTGNFPPAASVEACRISGDPDAATPWQILLDQVALSGDCNNLFRVQNDSVWTHLRLNIYPDGGIARLRVYGEVRPDWSLWPADQEIDLAAMENGGRALACNDAHFGAMENLIAPGDALNMGDGWETRRRREPGHDWVIIALAHPGSVSRIEVDTLHFKGNYPDQCALQATYLRERESAELVPQSLFWEALLPKQRLEANRLHCFADALIQRGPVSHVRLDIFPDGGVARLRVWGKLHRPGTANE